MSIPRLPDEIIFVIQDLSRPRTYGRMMIAFKFIYNRIVTSNEDLLQRCIDRWSIHHKTCMTEWSTVCGELHGTFMHFHPNIKLKGVVRSMQDYRLGKKHGRFMRFDKYGVLMQHCNFVDGQLHGDYFLYYSSGSLQYSATYCNGKLHGTAILYDTHCRCHKKRYVHGELQGKVKSWHNNGQLEAIYFVRDGARAGVEISWKRSGAFDQVIRHG